MSFEPIGPSEVAAFLPECRAFADSALQAVAPSSAMFGAVLPSFLAAVFLSTPRLRSLWAFRILFFALVATLGKGLLEMQMGILQFRQIQSDGLHALKDYDNVFNAVYCLQWYMPWICDCALLCKLLSFHPAGTTPWRRRALIMAFPVTMHIPRLPLLVVATGLALKAKTDSWDHIFAPYTSYRMLVAEGALQVAENCFCSGFLLYKAYQFACADYAASSQQARRARLGLRYFTESTLFTFLPASLLQIAWLLAVIIGSDNTVDLARAVGYQRFFNTLFSLNFGLLAVWWATARIHALEDAQTGTQLKSGSAGQKIRAPQDMSLLDWTLGPIEPEANPVTAGLDAPTEERKTLE